MKFELNRAVIPHSDNLRNNIYELGKGHPCLPVYDTL